MIEIRELDESDLARASALPLHRFDGFRQDATYLIAWEGEMPVGHVHVAWRDTELGIPALQDVFVLPHRRDAGIGSALTAEAERLAAAHGHRRVSLSVSDANVDARRLYERLGYTRADVAPKRVEGTIQVRGGTIEVDETLLYFTKEIG